MAVPLSSKERIARTLKREPADHIGAFESFWGDTHKKWAEQGHIGTEEPLADHFEMDLRLCGAFNLVADLDFEPEVLEETDETILRRDGNGALFRTHKLHASTPEHVDFLVKDRRGWEEHIRPLLTDADNYERRIGFEAYRKNKKTCKEKDLFFCWSGVNVFELMHPVCGHEYMLIGMALDPDWVRDMCTVYCELIINLMEILFDRDGLPDGIWFWEDMGFKQRPFMSPQMYREIVQPAHTRTFDYAHSLGLPVIVHSCGYVEPLVPGLIEAGMDCLQAMEVKAGMDLPRLKKLYGDRIAFMGGMDARTLESNDLDTVQAELERNLPAATEGGGYCLHSDHSVSDRVEYETYKFFVDRGREMGTYKST